MYQLYNETTIYYVINKWMRLNKNKIKLKLAYDSYIRLWVSTTKALMSILMRVSKMMRVLQTLKQK